MDIPRLLAVYISYYSGGIDAMPEPTPADMAGDHFVVSVENFWQEPEGITSVSETGEYAYDENGTPVELYRQALPIRVIYKSKYTGEKWRGIFIERTRLNALLFSGVFELPVFGGTLPDAPEEWAEQGGPGMGLAVELRRDPASDVVFKKDTSTRTSMGKKKEKQFGFTAEQHFKGNIYFQGGADVPSP